MPAPQLQKIRNFGIVAHGSQRIVVRRCHIHSVDYGFTATRNEPLTTDFFLADNVVEGPSTWPRTKGIEDVRGVQVTGTGHVVCYNRIRGFADAIDTFPSVRCAAIDFHNNDISEMTDDAISVDAGGLYRTLRRMEEEGFVTSKWVEGDSGPQKREYDLTAEGYELAEDWFEHLRERATLAAMLADELGQARADSGAGEGSTDG